MNIENLIKIGFQVFTNKALEEIDNEFGNNGSLGTFVQKNNGMTSVFNTEENSIFEKSSSDLNFNISDSFDFGDLILDTAEATENIIVNAFNQDVETLFLKQMADILEKLGNLENFLFESFGLSVDSNKNEKEEIIADILKKLYRDSDSKTALDLNGDGKLSSEEKSKFEEFIKGYDGDLSSLSEEDIIRAFCDIIFGDFSYDVNVEEKTSFYNNKKDSSSNKVTSSASNKGRMFSADISQNPAIKKNSTKTTVNTSQSIKSMSLSELMTEKTSRQNELKIAENNLNDVYSGENEAVKAANKNCLNAKKAYDDAINKDKNISENLKERRQTNIQEIGKQEAIVDNLKIDINNKESQISNQKRTVSSDKINLNAIKSAFSSLNKQKSDNAEIQKEIEDKKSELNVQLKQAERKLIESEKKLDEYNAQLSELQTKLQEENQVLKELENEKSLIEEEISSKSSKETISAMNLYNETLSEVREVKEIELRKAQRALNEAQTSLDAINGQINIKEAEETKKINTVKTHTLKEGIFNKGGALEGKEDLVVEIAEKYELEPEFFAAIICLESARGTSNLAVNHNNFGGVTGTGDAGSVRTSSGYKFASYSSVEVGLDAMAKNLASYDERFSDVNSVDIENVSAIGRHYCVGGDWANKIKQLYNEIQS